MQSRADWLNPWLNKKFQLECNFRSANYENYFRDFVIQMSRIGMKANCKQQCIRSIDVRCALADLRRLVEQMRSDFEIYIFRELNNFVVVEGARSWRNPYNGTSLCPKSSTRMSLRFSLGFDGWRREREMSLTTNFFRKKVVVSDNCCLRLLTFSRAISNVICLCAQTAQKKTALASVCDDRSCTSPQRRKEKERTNIFAKKKKRKSSLNKRETAQRNEKYF